MTSLYPDTSEIFYTESGDTPKAKPSKGLAKYFEDNKNFRYFSYLIKKGKIENFIGNLSNQTLFIPLNENLKRLGDEYFMKMSDSDAKKFSF